VESNLGSTDSVTSLIEKKVVVIAPYIRNDGQYNEKAEEGADENDQDTDVRDATGVQHGDGLVGNVERMERVNFIAIVLVVY